jgi:cobalamin biosynthesis protein CbiG
LAFFCKASVIAQSSVFSEVAKSTMIAKLLSGDSLLIYQCHVEVAEQQVSTAGGQTLSTAPQKYSITEKFVVKREGENYSIKHFVSSLLILPNRKFSGQKIREKEYWNYKKLREEKLDEKDLKTLAAIEIKGHEPNEYEYAITKDNTNMLIIKQRKNFKQLVGIGDLVLSKLILE